MKQLELVLLAGLAAGVAGCVARIDAAAGPGNTRGDVTKAGAEDDEGAGAAGSAEWRSPKPRTETAGSAGPMPQPAAAGSAAPKPRTETAGSAAPKPRTETAGSGGSMQSAAAGSTAPKPAASTPDASTPSTPPREMDAGVMQPMAAMPTAGSMSAPMDAGSACDFRGLVQAKCGSSGCHGGPSASTGLDLTSASLAMRVEGRKGPSACKDRLLIDPENPAQSALYLKVTGSSCGSQMPLGGSLSSSEKACFLSWIEGL